VNREVHAGFCERRGTRFPRRLTRLPAAEQQKLIARLRLTRHTRTTITTKTALRAELGRIAADGGLAVEDRELSAGRRAIAAVVMDADGGPVAAIELAVPAEAYSCDELLAELGPKVIATARDIGLDQACPK
jgi:IclR family transcriptional regulator, pca regulon regulatory protein